MNNENQTNIEKRLTDWLRKAFAQAFPESVSSVDAIAVMPATDAQFGDYQCNAAMGLARTLKTNPRQIAAQWVASVEEVEWVDHIDVAGPGFINIRIAASALEDELQTMDQDPRLSVPGVGRDRTVILDYSSPNVAKPMHIGHIRSTVIGTALDRLHRFLGFNVIADNHLGDWGTQFGLLIMGYRHFLDETRLREQPVEELERLYVQSYERSREDPDWLDAARKELVKLQQGDEENRALWQNFVDLSVNEFERIYNRLGVSFDLVRGESYYRDQLAAMVELLQRQGLAEESEGAQVVRLDDDGMPVCIVQKRDGGFNYATSDLATIKQRVEEFDPEQIIYVTDERQQLHFKQCFAIARKLGWTPDLVHVWFGLMRLPEGTFSTREGNVIKLERLLDEAEERALRLVQDTSPEMDPADQREVARAVGIGAIKYADLSQNPQSMITFTWDKALAMDGNSAPYLQYACARIASVQDKYRERYPDRDCAVYPIRLTEPVERRLALQLVRFAPSVVRATELRRPSLLADYLYDLAQTYSSFYQNVPFLKAEEGVRESRIRLCGLVVRVLRQGLTLLGIETPNRI